MKPVEIMVGSQHHGIVVNRPVSAFAKKIAGEVAPGAKVVVVADGAVAQRIGRPISRAFRRLGVGGGLVVVPPGEGSKTLAQAARLYRFAVRAGLDRHGWLVAVGGGVVSDLTGFVAGTLYRGLSWAVVPTTLLAQVDAAIGGKTAVDIPEGKNLVGVFHAPRWVWVDPTTLKTLPRAHWRNGVAEVIKYAAIGDLELLSLLEKQGEAVGRGYTPVWDDIIRRCIAFKAGVVRSDPFETRGHRAILNFGHTVGHALEAAAGFREILHGEAVAIGMFVAANVSQVCLGLDALDKVRLGTLITRAGLPLQAPRKIPRELLLAFLRRDKKAKAGSVRFVLLEKLGRAKPGVMVPPEALEAALSASNL